MDRPTIFGLIAVAFITAGVTLLVGLALYFSPNGGSQTLAPTQAPMVTPSACALCVPASR